MGTPRLRPAGPVWLALRADLRLRWRAVLGLALLLGLIGGVVLTAAAAPGAPTPPIPGCSAGPTPPACRSSPPAPAWAGSTTGSPTCRRWRPSGPAWCIRSPCPHRHRRIAARGRGQPGRRPRHVHRPGAGAGRAAVRPRRPAGGHGRTRNWPPPRTCGPVASCACSATPAPPRPVPPGGPAAPGRARPVPLAFRVSAVVAFDDQVVPSPGLSGAPGSC